jgi:AcrR family transcriptional regulator
VQLVSESTGVTQATDTRHKIMAAALETIRVAGITGASARAIAATGGFNQAMIFYHFGSVTNLLIEAARTSSAARVAAYREVAEEVSSLTSLVDVARRLHHEAEQDGSIAVLTQLMAGAASDQAMGQAILEGFEGWIRLVEDALEKALEGQPIASAIPAREMAYSISALFLGIELMARLDPEKSEAASVFDALHELAELMESMPAMMSRFIKSKRDR